MTTPLSGWSGRPDVPGLPCDAEGPVFGVDDRGISRGYANHPKLVNPVKEIDPKRAPWSKRFPEMVNLLENRPELPLRTGFTKNLVVIQKGDPFVLKMKAETKAVPTIFEEGDNMVTAADPGFVDVANGNLALKPDSEVFTKIPGFQPIPFEKIGLIKDEYQRELPTAESIARPKNNPMFQKDEESHFGT